MQRALSAAALLSLAAGIACAAEPTTVNLARASGDSHPDGRIVLPDTAVPVHYDIVIEPDSKNLTFKGSVSIRLKVKVPTDRIVLNARDLVVDRASLTSAAAPAISYNDKVQTATFTFPSQLNPGEYVLSLDYHGRIFQQAYGLFALDYQTPQGPRRALFTQFENADARRFVPCWDEPGRKATFSLAATVPAELMAISNMPISARETLPGGLQRVHFAETPKMSSYLLFFGLGDLERIHREVDGIDLGVVVKRGDTASAQFALDAAAQILPYYNDYFGTPYPLPALDLIAGPGSSTFFGAMENWGAIFFCEKRLLFDPKISTEFNRFLIHTLIAHEMSHQWFGNLVTMQWWDDVWLNEGFASWMQKKATDHFHPEWKVWLRSLSEKSFIMATDARDGTHPVVTPINDVLQASSAFDGITYTKGEAVIRMLEAYIGEEAFRAGVRQYMKDYAYGNAVTDDLLREIDATSDRKVTRIAHEFTLQAGVPMITVTPSGKGLRLSEDRFALDSSGASGGTWQVPVNILSAPGNGPAAMRRVVVSADTPTMIPDIFAGAVVNAGQTGYFCVRYQDQAFTALRDRFGSLTADDQLGILLDMENFCLAGATSAAGFLDLASRTPPDADPAVWSMLADEFRWLDLMHDGLASQAAFRAYARGQLAPECQRIGFDSKAGEPEDTAILRSSLLSAMGRLSDAAVVKEAQRRFSHYLQDPASLSGSARDSVLTIVAMNADQATWDKLHSLARTATSSVEKQDYYSYLGGALDPALGLRALDLALADEVEVTIRPVIIRSVSYKHPMMAFDYAVRHWEDLGKLIEDPDRRSVFIAYLLSNANKTEVLIRLDAFAAAHVSPSNKTDIRKIAAAVRDLARIRTERLPEIDRWVAARVGAPGP